jgi:succinate dehydrogenase / fumarate reductase membrane anchor subunit
MTAVANVPLVIFLILSVITHIGADYEIIRAYLARPVVAIAMLALVISASTHMRIGMKEIIEDYVHGEGARVAAILLATFFAVGVALACTFALVKISLGS